MRRKNPRNSNRKQMTKNGTNKHKGWKLNREKVKKELKDYFYYNGSSEQASDFESTTDFVMNHIKEDFWKEKISQNH